MYYFADMDVDLSPYYNKAASVDLVLNVGETENLAEDHDYRFDDFVSRAEVYSIQIDGQDLYTLDDYLNSKKGSNLAIGVILGGVGLLFAILGVVSAVKKR